MANDLLSRLGESFTFLLVGGKMSLVIPGLVSFDPANTAAPEHFSLAGPHKDYSD